MEHGADSRRISLTRRFSVRDKALNQTRRESTAAHTPDSRRVSLSNAARRSSVREKALNQTRRESTVGHILDSGRVSLSNAVRRSSVLEKTPYQPQRESVCHSVSLPKTKTRFSLAIFVVFTANFLDWCLISVLTPSAPSYLGLANTHGAALSRLGVVVGANAGVQLLSNIFIGRIIDRAGATFPFLVGMVVMLCSTLLLAFAGDISWTHRYEIVLAARMLQGLSSGVASTSGMAWLCSIFDSEQRPRAIGLAITGTGLGVVVGMPLGSAFASLGVVNGWRVPFLILDALLLVNICLLLFSLGSRLPKLENNDDGLGWRILLRLASDPYIVLVFVMSLLLNVCIATVEASLPSWLTLTLKPPRWSLGVIFIACHIPYTILACVCSKLFLKVGQHWALFFGNLAAGTGMLIAPVLIYHCYWSHLSPGFVSIFLVFIGAGMGLFDAASMAFAADIVEKRHASLMGSACAVINASWSMGFFLGPFLCNFLIDRLSFQLVYTGLGELLVLSSFAVVFLRHIPVTNLAKVSKNHRL